MCSVGEAPGTCLGTPGVEGEEQWGENTALRSSSADHTGVGCVFSQPH